MWILNKKRGDIALQCNGSTYSIQYSIYFIENDGLNYNTSDLIV